MKSDSKNDEHTRVREATIGGASLTRATTPKSILRRTMPEHSTPVDGFDRKKVTFEAGSLLEEKLRNSNGSGGRLCKRSATIHRPRGGINMRGTSAGPLLGSTGQALNLNVESGHSPPSGTSCHAKVVPVRAGRKGGSWSWLDARTPAVDPSIGNAIMQKARAGAAGAPGMSSRGRRMFQVQEARNQAAMIAAAAVAAAASSNGKAAGEKVRRQGAKDKASEEESSSCTTSPSESPASTASPSPSRSRSPSVSPSCAKSTSPTQRLSPAMDTCRPLSPCSTSLVEGRSPKPRSKCALDEPARKSSTPGDSLPCVVFRVLIPDRKINKRASSWSPSAGGERASSAAVPGNDHSLVAVGTKLKIAIPTRRLSPAERVRTNARTNATTVNCPDRKLHVVPHPSLPPPTTDIHDFQRSRKRQAGYSETEDSENADGRRSGEEMSESREHPSAAAAPVVTTCDEITDDTSSVSNVPEAEPAAFPSDGATDSAGSDAGDAGSFDGRYGNNGQCKEKQQPSGRLRYRHYASGTMPAVVLLSPDEGDGSMKCDPSAVHSAEWSKAIGYAVDIFDENVGTEGQDRSDEAAAVAVGVRDGMLRYTLEEVAVGMFGIAADDGAERNDLDISRSTAGDKDRVAVDEKDEAVIENGKVKDKDDASEMKKKALGGKHTVGEGKGTVTTNRQGSSSTRSLRRATAPTILRPLPSDTSESSESAEPDTLASVRVSPKPLAKLNEAPTGSTPSRSKSTPAIVTPPSEDSPRADAASPASSRSSCTSPNRGNTCGGADDGLSGRGDGAAISAASCDPRETASGREGGRRGRRSGLVHGIGEVSALAWDSQPAEPASAIQPGPLSSPAAAEESKTVSRIAELASSPVVVATPTPTPTAPAVPSSPSVCSRTDNEAKPSGVDGTEGESTLPNKERKMMILEETKRVSAVESSSSSVVVASATKAAADAAEREIAGETLQMRTDHPAVCAYDADVDWEDLPLWEVLRRRKMMQNSRSRHATASAASTASTASADASTQGPSPKSAAAEGASAGPSLSTAGCFSITAARARTTAIGIEGVYFGDGPVEGSASGNDAAEAVSLTAVETLVDGAATSAPATAAVPAPAIPSVPPTVATRKRDGRTKQKSAKPGTDVVGENALSLSDRKNVEGDGVVASSAAAERRQDSPAVSGVPRRDDTRQPAALPTPCFHDGGHEERREPIAERARDGRERSIACPSRKLRDSSESRRKGYPESAGSGNVERDEVMKVGIESGDLPRKMLGRRQGIAAAARSRDQKDKERQQQELSDEAIIAVTIAVSSASPTKQSRAAAGVGEGEPKGEAARNSLGDGKKTSEKGADNETQTCAKIKHKRRRQQDPERPVQSKTSNCTASPVDATTPSGGTKAATTQSRAGENLVLQAASQQSSTENVSVPIFEGGSGLKPTSKAPRKGGRSAAATARRTRRIPTNGGFPLKDVKAGSTGNEGASSASKVPTGSDVDAESRKSERVVTGVRSTAGARQGEGAGSSSRDSDNVCNDEGDAGGCLSGVISEIPSLSTSTAAATTKKNGFCGWMRPVYFYHRRDELSKGHRHDGKDEAKRCHGDKGQNGKAKARLTGTSHRFTDPSSLLPVSARTVAASVAGHFSQPENRAVVIASATSTTLRQTCGRRSKGQNDRPARKKSEVPTGQTLTEDPKGWLTSTENRQVVEDDTVVEKKKCRKRAREEVPEDAEARGGGGGSSVRGWLGPMWSMLHKTVGLW